MTHLKKGSYWLPAIFWMSLIFYLSSRTTPTKSDLLARLGHFIEYSVLAFLLMIALNATTKLKGGRLFLSIFFISVSYGLTDEVHQLFVPGRFADVNDLYMDGFGALGGILIYTLLNSVFQRIFNRVI